MRTFEITMFDRFGQLIRRHLAVAATRGQAFRQAILLMGGAARFVVEEI